jgi:uncharacterized protein YfaT (DUF1175 family)
MTGAMAAMRAMSALAFDVDYRLGAGGRDPASPTPADDEGNCDCSGYVAWCLGISRRVRHPAYVRFNGGWLSTDGMVHDALSVGGILDQVPGDDRALPGDVVVYGNGARIGHCGIIVRIAPLSSVKPREQWEIAHCSSRAPANHAIRVTSYERFTHGAQSTVHLLRPTGWAP